MRKPRICATIIVNDLGAVKQVEPLVDLFEVRIDLIGDGWQELVKQLTRPWIACNRSASEGGHWRDNEARRIEKLLAAMELGADIIDIELRTNNLEKIIKLIQKRTRCLLSFHDLEKTPPFDELKRVVQRQLKAGADICKVVTTAQSIEDNWSVLQLVPDFPGVKLISFAMGPWGIMSRVLCPLVGGEFTYASIKTGKESAPGQPTVSDLLTIYEMLRE